MRLVVGAYVICVVSKTDDHRCISQYVMYVYRVCIKGSTIMFEIQEKN